MVCRQLPSWYWDYQSNIFNLKMLQIFDKSHLFIETKFENSVDKSLF